MHLFCEVTVTASELASEREQIAAFEAQFAQIKEVAGADGVNEVIEKFTAQEETHATLVALFYTATVTPYAISVADGAPSQKVCSGATSPVGTPLTFSFGCFLPFFAVVVVFKVDI